MRINVYAEEMTERVELVHKQADGRVFTGVRFYTYMPVTLGSGEAKGPFLHRPGDDDSSAITFWGKRELKTVLREALRLLDQRERMENSVGQDADNRKERL